MTISAQRDCPRPFVAEAPAPAGHNDRPIPGFAVSTRHVHGNVVNVHLLGELDVLTVPVLHEALATLRAAAPDAARCACTTVRVDLSGLAFLDCTGLTALLDTRTALTDWGWQVDLGDPRGCVARFLALADSLGFFPLGVRWPLPPSSGPGRLPRAPHEQGR